MGFAHKLNPNGYSDYVWGTPIDILLRNYVYLLHILYVGGRFVSFPLANDYKDSGIHLLAKSFPKDLGLSRYVYKQRDNYDNYSAKTKRD